MPDPDLRAKLTPHYEIGCKRVLISDDYLLPAHVAWDRFLIRIAERDIARMPELLEPHVASAADYEAEKYVKGLIT